MLEAGTAPAVARPGLRYMSVLLRDRFRYDIGLDQTPAIKVGEFDIELD